LFARAFKAPVVVPDDLVDAVEAGLARRALEALGLARRAGAAAVGFEQVKALLLEKRAGVLISAADAAADGRDKLAALASDVFHCRAFSTSALSAALGREGVRHAAIRSGAAAARFRREAMRLSGLLPPSAAAA
jgi:hypothetical protein